jgi:cytochrome c oxidase subunit 4
MSGDERTGRATRAGESEGASGRSLFASWLALMLLAGLSLALRFAHLGSYGMGVALAIAAVKAVIVALVFMELAFEKPSIRFAFAAGLLMIGLMLALMIGDVVTRSVPPLANPPGMQPRADG